MTREEAIKIIRKMLAYTDLTVRANLNADMVSACNLAIKALEQEPVVDKIRAEIKAMSGDIETIADVLKIIDKYKTESEEI